MPVKAAEEWQPGSELPPNVGNYWVWVVDPYDGLEGPTVDWFDGDQWAICKSIIGRGMKPKFWAPINPPDAR